MLTDDEINGLIVLPKQLPENFYEGIRLKPKRGHDERELLLNITPENIFRLVLRQNQINRLDFSAILSYNIIRTNVWFRLRRYNGIHEHTNNIEHEKFLGFHIHYATERYQNLGLDEDSYAEKTDSYADLHGALRQLFQDCNFIFPPHFQLELL